MGSSNFEKKSNWDESINNTVTWLNEHPDYNIAIWVDMYLEDPGDFSWDHRPGSAVFGADDTYREEAIKRLAAIKKALMKKGVDKDRIVIKQNKGVLMPNGGGSYGNTWMKGVKR